MNTLTLNGKKVLTPENFVNMHMIADNVDLQFKLHLITQVYKITALVAPNKHEFSRNQLEFLFGNGFIRDCDEALQKYIRENEELFDANE